MSKRAIGLAALAAGALLARFVPAQESPPAAAESPPPAAAEETTPPATARDAPPAPAPRAPAGSQAPRADVFIPSEEIQADEEVTFPVDI